MFLIPTAIYRLDAKACGRGWKGTKGSCVRKKASELDKNKASLSNVAKGGAVDKDRKKRQERIAFLKAKKAGDAKAMAAAGPSAKKPLPVPKKEVSKPIAEKPQKKAAQPKAARSSKNAPKKAETPAIDFKKIQQKWMKGELLTPDEQGALAKAMGLPAPAQKAENSSSKKTSTKAKEKGWGTFSDTTTPAERKRYKDLNDFDGADGEKHKNARKKALNRFSGPRLNKYEALKDAPPPHAEEVAALSVYTGSQYKKINSALRSGGGSESIRNEAKMAVAALRNMPKQEGTVYRGSSLPSSLVSSYKKGKIIEELGFASTSESREVSEGFIEGTMERDSKPVLFVINSKNGRAVSSISSIPEEKEILFEPRTKFKVLEVGEENGKTVIYMDEN